MTQVLSHIYCILHSEDLTSQSEQPASSLHMCASPLRRSKRSTTSPALALHRTTRRRSEDPIDNSLPVVREHHVAEHAAAEEAEANGSRAAEDSEANGGDDVRHSQEDIKSSQSSQSSQGSQGSQGSSQGPSRSLSFFFRKVSVMCCVFVNVCLISPSRSLSLSLSVYLSINLSLPPSPSLPSH